MTSGYRVSGTQILGPDGQPFIPRGINIGGTLSSGGAYPDFSRDAQYATDFIARGGNTVRFATNASDRYAWGAYTAGYSTTWGGTKLYGTDGAVLYAKHHIDFWRARGVVVLVECHEFTSGGFTQAQTEQCEAFWLRMANEYKNDTGVWFNLYNEPNVYSQTFDGPLNGNVSTVRTRWAGLHARAAKLIRDAGAPNIIVCDTFGYAGDSGKQADGKPAPRGFDPGAAPLLSSLYGGIVLSWHNYGHHDVLTTEAAIHSYIDAVHASGVPLIVGEVGYPVKRGWDMPEFMWPTLRNAFDMSLQSVPKKNVGILFWSSAFNDGFKMYIPYWDWPNGASRIINEFAAELPEGRSLSGQGVRFMQYLTNGQSVTNTGPSHSGGTAEE